MSTLSQTRLLLRAEVRAIRNRVAARRGGQAMVVVAVLAYGFVAVLVALGMYQVGRLGVASADGSLARLLAAATGLMLVVAAGPVITQFFMARSLLLLSTMPVRRAAVYLSRALVVAAGGGVILGGLVVALVGYGLGIGAPPGYWLAVAVGAPLLGVSIVGIHLTLFWLAIRIAPPHRVRDVAVVVSSLAVSLLYVGQFAATRSLGGGPAQYRIETVTIHGGVSSLVEASRACSAVEPIAGGDLRCTRVAVVDVPPALAASSFPSSIPFGWPGKALAGFATGDSSAAAGWSAASVLAMLAAVAAGLVLYARSVSDGIAALLEAPRTRGRRQGRAVGERRRARRPVVRSLMRKDLLLLRRDVRRLGSVAPVLVMSVVYPFVIAGASGGPAAGWQTWVRLLPLLYAPFFIGSTVGPLLINSEARAVNVLRLAPIPLRAVLRAKDQTMALVSGAVTLAISIVFCAAEGVGAGAATLAAAGSLWIACCIGSASLSFAAMAPNFDAEARPRTAGCVGAAVVLGAVAAPATLGVGCLVVALPQLSGVPAATPATRAAALLGAAVLLGVSAAVVAGARALAVRSLDAWEPAPH